jgi:hypothetical protein
MEMCCISCEAGTEFYTLLHYLDCCKELKIMVYLSHTDIEVLLQPSYTRRYSQGICKANERLRGEVINNLLEHYTAPTDGMLKSV